jgi:phage FluMu gp28-like protein
MNGMLTIDDLQRAPAVLLPYQQQWVADTAEVKIVEKSRRIGITWAESSDDVLVAATEGRDGEDVLYIGYNQEMTREYIQTCAWWAKQFAKVCTDIDEFVFKDKTDDGDKDIAAFRISFASGHQIVALSSRPTNLRGRQGRVVIDEAAFHEDLAGLMKAALALLMWGGQVVVISTHFGDANYFNQLIEDCRAGRLPYSVHRYDFDEALEDGLYARICLVRGEEWSAEKEADWRNKIIASYGDDADEELFCIPSQGGGAYLLRSTIEACWSPAIPVVRFSPPSKDFVDWRDDQRFREVRDWCLAELDPLLAGLPQRPSYFGEDFGRDCDLTVIWPLQSMPGATLATPFLLELRDCPFAQQEQILFHVCDRLPRLSGGALDKGGNGAFLAERARQEYGEERIEQVSFHDSWYLENWPPAKAHLEDRTVSIPRDNDVMDDLRAVQKVKGVPKIPSTRTRAGDGGKRHGDAAIAFVLAVFASRHFEYSGPAEYRSVTKRRVNQRGAW